MRRFVQIENQGRCTTHQEEKLKPVYYGADAQDWLPVLTQYVQADVAFQVNVWVKDLTRISASYVSHISNTRRGSAEEVHLSSP